jgi:hypothetical protein
MRYRLLCIAVIPLILSVVSCTYQPVTLVNSTKISPTEGVKLSDSSIILNLTEALPDWRHTSLASGYTGFSRMEIYTSETVYGNHEIRAHFTLLTESEILESDNIASNDELARRQVIPMMSDYCEPETIISHPAIGDAPALMAIADPVCPEEEYGTALLVFRYGEMLIFMNYTYPTQKGSSELIEVLASSVIIKNIEALVESNRVSIQE